jgi:hypothetical protein
MLRLRADERFCALARSDRSRDAASAQKHRQTDPHPFSMNGDKGSISSNFKACVALDCYLLTMFQRVRSHLEQLERDIRRSLHAGYRSP